MVSKRPASTTNLAKSATETKPAYLMEGVVVCGQLLVEHNQQTAMTRVQYLDLDVSYTGTAPMPFINSALKASMTCRHDAQKKLEGLQGLCGGEMRLWNTGLSDCVRRERGSGQRHSYLGGSLNLNYLASERKVGHCAAFEHSHQATIRT